MRTLAAFSVVAVLTVLVVGGCNGGGEGSPTPTEVATGTPSPTAVADEGLRLVYKEFGSEADVIWTAAADQPRRRTKVAEVEHAPDMGISASLSPTGEHIVYLVLAAAGGAPAMDAEAWLLEVDSGETRLLASDLDGAIKPVWSPDGSSIVLCRNGPQAQIGQAVSLLKVDVSDGEETPLMQADNVLGLFPVGYSPDGDSLYFGAVAVAGGSPRLLVHASDESARDWHASPDGARVAFLARQPTDDRIAIRALVAELVEDAEPQPLSDFSDVLDSGDHFNPVWHPDGERVAVGRSPSDGSSPAALVSLTGGELEEVTPGPALGFDVPAGWSPEGGYLAVRSFDGSSAAQPGREQLVIIEVGKGRQAVVDTGNPEFIGWLVSGSE
jgi:Tol biopolymer transport system component